MKRTSLSLVLVAFLGCSSSESTPTPAANNDAGSDTPTNDPGLAIACIDTEASIYADPGALPAEKGAIIRCAKGAPLTMAELQAKATGNGYTGKPFTSGARVYRILYRTERGGPETGAPLAGASSAIVYLPDTPRVAQSPVVAVAHGSRGQAPACAPSKKSPESAYVEPDFENVVYAMVGAGYAVIAPDWAGYANYGAPTNPPSAYASTGDTGKSMLDGTRAMKNLAPSILSDKVVIVGHSQGGHAALSTLATSATYGAGGPVAATVVFSPIWVAPRTFGAILFLPDVYNFADYLTVNATSIWYHYTHSELLDGPGHGGDVFRADKRAAIKKFIDETCWAEDYPMLKALGTTPADVFDPTFAEAIGAPAGTGAACPTDEPKKSLCMKWLARYKADRPALMGDAAKVPVLFLYGNKDASLPPDRMTCARDWLKSTGGNVTYCVTANDDHPGIVKTQSSYAADWIAEKVLGAPAVQPCALDETKMLDPKTGMPATCATIPPNE